MTVGSSCLEECFPQALELHVLRMQAAQVGVGSLGRGQLGHDGLGVLDRRHDIENAAERRWIDASALGVARILQQLEREPGFRFAESLRRALAVGGVPVDQTARP